MASNPSKSSLGIIFLTVFIDLLGFGMVLPLLPAYAAQFAVDESGWTIGLLMSSFSAMQFLFAPVWGRISDRVGRRPVLLIGLAGSVVFYALFGVAAMQRSLWLLFASRIGAGISGATISTAQAYIADATGLEGRARGMALIGAAFGLGFTFGPLLGAAALLGSTEHSTSPWPGFAAAGLSFVAVIVAYFRLPESLRPQSATTSHRWVDVRALRDALAIPSIGLLLLTSFVSVLSFANLESTLSLLLRMEEGGFGFTYPRLLMVFAYVGFVLTFAQGFLVRRLATRVPEAFLAAGGAGVAAVGFLILAASVDQARLAWLFVGLFVEVTGFAFVTPSIQSLISRRSDPARQGGILGVGQSVTAMARIIGPVVGIRLFYAGSALPFWVATGIMLFALVIVITAARSGRDFAVE